MLLLQQGHILDPFTGTDKISDILIDNNGIITRIAEHIDAPENCAIYPANGQTIAPGFIDGHVHFRDPGQTDKEDVSTGAAAAAAGGYSTVVCMANTIPTCDSPKIIQYVTDKSKSAPVQVLQAGAITYSLQGEKLTDFPALLKAGAPCLTNDGINLNNAGCCRRAMEEAVKYDALLSFHEEEPSLVPSPGVNYGSAAAKKFHVIGAHPSAETAMIARDIALALDTGARVLFQHVSCAQSVELIRAGKALGAKIYAEVTPHHLSMTEDDVLHYGTRARMNPPLRKASDRQALIAGLQDGTIDVIATDHAPHTKAEKERSFDKAPSGIIGLETAFSVCNTVLVCTKKLTKMQLLEKMSRNPAELYRLSGRAIQEGNYARLVLLDWDSPIQYKRYYSKAENTPFTGVPLVGKPCGTIQGCRITVNTEK